MRHPGHIDALCAMGETSHLGVLVVGPEVEMQSALGRLGLIEADEVQPRDAIGCWADLELVSRGVDGPQTPDTAHLLVTRSGLRPHSSTRRWTV
jgi:hypothetical protein